MKIQQTTNNYSLNNLNFKAGKIKILDPHCWTNRELEALATNDEFKKLAKICGEKGSDLCCQSSRTYPEDVRSVTLNMGKAKFFELNTFTVYPPHKTIKLFEYMKYFSVEKMLKQLEEDYYRKWPNERGRKKIMQMIEDFNNGKI